MKRIPRLNIWLLAPIFCAVPLKADESAVFAFHGSNAAQERIEGTIVLNRSSVRTTTSNGYSFATPVQSLHYTISDPTGFIAEFTFSEANPNSLTIIKGKKNATSFHLRVEPIPTDPPFPGPLAFTMDFAFDGVAPWGDWVPDRTITGAHDVSVGASDLYNQSVSIVEISQNEIAAIETELRRLEAAFGAVYKQPGFKIPGSTPSERVTALVMGIERSSPGQRKQLYDYLTAAP